MISQRLPADRTASEITRLEFLLVVKPDTRMDHLRIKPSVWLIAVVLSLACVVSAQASEPSHGISIFGPETLKYGPDETFAYLNPNAPIAGRLKMASGNFTKLSPFGLMGSEVPLLHDTIFETLGLKSWDDDEPYSMYGLIAESFELADDNMSMLIRLRPEARFSDGEPLTADDVVFSYNLAFNPHVNPRMRITLRNVERFEKVDEHTVNVIFKKFTRDLPIHVAHLYVYPKHIYGVPGVNLDSDFNERIPVGSGPYRLESYVFGERVTYQRREDYWARNLVRRKGMWNWKWIECFVFFDNFSRLEALKSGLISFQTVDPIVYKNFGGEFVEKNYLVKHQFPITRPSAMQCIAFNMRRPLFQDRRLRQIIASLYDFEFINRNFYEGAMFRLNSYFHLQPHLRATSGPATGRVREVLLDLAKRHNKPEQGLIYVPKEALEIGPYDHGKDIHGNPIPISVRIEAANRELDRMGWKWDPSIGARRRGDEVLKFEIMDSVDVGVYHFAETLEQAGIRAKVAKPSPLEKTNRMRAFRFELVHDWYDGRFAPGRELARNFLSSEADVSGSHNMMGLKNPAVDEVLELVMKSRDYEAVGIYARVFDRMMTANCYVIPKNWPKHDRGIYWNSMGRPEQYCSGLWLYHNILWFWWEDEQRRERLEEAMEHGVVFEP